MANKNRHEQTMPAPDDRVCLDCHEDIPDTETAFYWETSHEERFWAGAPPAEGPVCEACWVKRDNREPADPDSEAFRGGEAAAFQAEQLDAARRLK